MPLFEVLPTTTPAVQQLTRELASLLPQLAVTQVTTEHEGMRLYQYQQTEKCKELHRALFKELAQVCIRRKAALATNTNAKGKQNQGCGRNMRRTDDSEAATQRRTSCTNATAPR